jgi:hypothetical protein
VGLEPVASLGRRTRIILTIAVAALGTALLAYGVALWMDSQPERSADGIQEPRGPAGSISGRVPPGPRLEDPVSGHKETTR